MDSDAEVKRGRLPSFRKADFVAGALIACILGAGIALRVARFHVGDYYEDGASHWWTAASAIETGVLRDAFNLSTRGAWLPGYDHLAVAVMQATGSSSMDVLRATGVAFFVAAELALFALALPAGRGVAIAAMGMLAVSPFDTLNSPIAIGMEPAVAFLCAALALLQRSRAGGTTQLIGASVFFFLAVLFRYEAVPFIGVLVLYNWWWSGGRPLNRHHATREFPYLVAPLVVFAIFLLFTWGHNFPSRVFTDPPPELGSTEALGYIPQDPVGRNVEFWSFWTSAAPAAIALALVGIVVHFRKQEAWLVVVFMALLAIFLFLNLGTPSVRYLEPVEPMMWFLAALGGQFLLRKAAVALRGLPSLRPDGLARKGVAAACLVLLLFSTVASGEAAMLAVDQRVALHGPLHRAGAFLANQPQDESLLVLVDSPIAAADTGIAPTRMIGSRLLPEDREAALAYLKEKVQYVLAVNVSYYRLIVFFPELGRGQSTADFSLLYDATGWEIAYSAKTAFVYRVNHDTGLLAASADYRLSFPFHAWDDTGRGPGVQVMYRNENLTEGSAGLGFPTMTVDGRAFAPAEVEGRFTGDTPTTGFDVDYTLYARGSGGLLETNGSPASVQARYRLAEAGLTATFMATPPPGTTTFALRANNSVPSRHFPTTFNDSIPAPTEAPSPDGLVWSLQSWFLGEDAYLQFDYAAPAVVRGGRQAGGDAWLTYEAPENSAVLTYPLYVLPPGTELFKPSEPHLLKSPLYRAGGFLAGAPRNTSQRIFADYGLGDFPYLAESSGLPSTAFANSSSLPGDRGAALQWLRSEFGLVVAVNQTADPLLALFPELANGDSNHNFSLVFDAGGPAGSLTRGLVWVYQVNRGEGIMHTDSAAAFKFRFTQDESEGIVRGLSLSAGGVEVAHPAPGFGVPSARVNGTDYAAGAAALDFVPGSLGSVVAGTYWLYPQENGTLNRSAPALAVSVEFRFADMQLHLNMTAVPATPTDNVTLTGGIFVQTTAFANFTNDLDNLTVTGDYPRTLTWAIRNWFNGPTLTLQADFKDPYALFVTRALAATSSFEYEAPPGVRALQVAIWVVPAA